MKQRDLVTRFAWDAMGLQPGQALEVQRAFNRAGEVSAFAAAHRGPGGGPEATPCTATLLSLAGLDGGQCINAPGAAFGLFGTPLEGNDTGPEFQPGLVPDTIIIRPESTLARCPITGAVTFGDALVAIFGNATLAATIDRIEVRRGVPDARIYATDGRCVRFVADADRVQIVALDARGAFRTVAIVGGAVLAAMAREIAA